MPKIVLIGAGSLQFGCDTIGDIFNTEMLKGSEVVLHDISAPALAVVNTAVQDFLVKNNLEKDFKVKATTERQEALQGADFIISSIEVGDRFKLWDEDRTIPQQYGIRQVYGENGGPGGLFHSLRIVPPILDICADVQAIAPNAWIFNYSNPMSRICTTVHRAFPHLNFVGLCHEVSSLGKHLPPMLGKTYEELDVLAAGLNHFSCLLSVSDKNTGKDLYPAVKEKAADYFRKLPGCSDFLEEYYKSGHITQTEGWHELEDKISTSFRNYVERQLFMFVLKEFDLLPITSDSHFGEYIQWAADEVDHRGIMDFYVYYRTVLGTRQSKPAIKLERHERVIAIIEALLGGEIFVEEAVNIPNKGYINELPEWLAVEVPATISKDKIEGFKIPELPKPYAGLLRNQVAVHDMTAEAILKKTKKSVHQALLVDPVVTTSKNLKEMVDVLCSVQRDYLGYLS